MRVAYILPLLLAGIVTGIVFPGKLTDVFGSATLYVFLPALIFDGAWRLDIAAMRRMWLPIALLAVPGVIATAAIIAACTHYGGGISWPGALLLGAILGATDPVAVLAVFRNSPLPRLLTTLVESEALLNDAVAVVIFRAVLAAATLAIAQPAGTAVFALAGCVLGIACGTVFGLAGAVLGNSLRRPLAYAPITFAGAFGAYYVASRFEWSGIFATLAFGLTVQALSQRRMGAPSRESVGRFWDAVALVANAVLFFLIGAALDVTQLGRALPVALLTAAVVIAARYAIVYGLLEFVRPRLHVAWLTVVRMAGIRGALSLALALAIPPAFPQRELIVNATFAVVIVTLLLGVASFSRKPAP